MKRITLTIIVSLSLLAPALCRAQGKIYTRKARLEDFPAKTTQVVLSGNPILDASIKEEIASRWRISPYEFCSVSEYKTLKESQGHYFLRMADDGDFTYLIASKGGKEKDTDPMKEGFDIVSCPISGAGDALGSGIVYLPAYIDIVQDFIEQARVSDRVAYSGLKGIVSKGASKSGVVTDAKEAETLFLEGAPGMRIGISIRSADGKSTYRMIVGTDTNKLHYIKKEAVREPQNP